MALLDQVLGYLVNQTPPSQTDARAQTPAPGAQISASGLSPIAKSVMLVLAAKAWQSYSAQRASSVPSQSSSSLGSMGAGGLLAMLGGAAALKGLIGRFEQSGFTDQTRSWIGSGENVPIEADQMERALGGGTLEELAQRFQVPVDLLKRELVTALPQAVDQLTPQGELPSDADLAKL